MSSEAAVEMQGGKWKRYPAYRDSGVEWIGEVPEHWMAKRLKYITTANDETLSETTDPDFELVYVDIGSIDPISGIRNKETMTFENAPSRARRKVRNGDVIISTVRTYLRAISPVNNPESNMVVSTGFAVIRPKENIESQFAAYALRAPYFVDKVVANSVGVSYPAINASELINFNIALPPLPEQHAIAAFLDHETGRIDTLIEKKKRQIELLQEKRAALISHTVTKGLDPDVTMKNSGVEWIGEVPEEWEVKKLKHIASVKFSSVDKKTEEGEHSVCLCNYVDVYYNDYITPDLDLMKATASVAEIQNFTLRGGDILITKDSESCDDIAIPAYVLSDINNVLCGYHLAQIRPNISLSDGEYLFRSFYVHGINNQFRVAATGITRYGLGKYWLDNSLFLVPPLPEQRAIAAFLDYETVRIDSLIEKITVSIEKLREYRVSIISAAITGKIDVRKEEPHEQC